MQITRNVCISYSRASPAGISTGTYFHTHTHKHPHTDTIKHTHTHTTHMNTHTKVNSKKTTQNGWLFLVCRCTLSDLFGLISPTGTSKFASHKGKGRKKTSFEAGKNRHEHRYNGARRATSSVIATTTLGMGVALDSLIMRV